MKFVTFVLRHPSKPDKPWNYRMHHSLEKNIEVARKKAAAMNPGYKIVTWGWSEWWEIIYSLPIFNQIDLNKKKV